MNTQNQTRLASALVFVPFILGTVIHMFGGRSLTTSMTYASASPISYPTRFSFEIYGAGVVLAPLLTVGIIWLSLLALQHLRRNGRTQSA